MNLTFKTEISGKELKIQTGKMARQASGGVLVQYGETIVLVTAVSASEPKPDISFLPLTVEYQEKIYAAGRIPGNYFRREIGRPSEKETLTARLIDRPIRPLFPKGYNFETQVIATVLSMDKENEPDILALIGASAALSISDIPFAGPIAAVRIGRIDGELVVNPAIESLDKSDMNIVVAGSKNGITMVEGGAAFVSEADITKAIFFAHEKIQPLINIQEKLIETFGKEKRAFTPVEVDPALAERVCSIADEPIKNAVSIPEKVARKEALKAAFEKVMEELGEESAEIRTQISEIFYNHHKEICRRMILDQGKRIDGRKTDEIRPITCETGLLPRVHGSALFTRGETQVLAALTLGSGQDEQRIETLMGDELHPFMLHYNFPPYSVGEVKRITGPSRRDIGHGALAKRALERVIPPKEEFDYTIRVVAEVLESNGSSSMGTVCSSSMALMDGGVPVKAGVSGIAMGLISDGDRVAILSDILGDEDHFGDMDFKVAGTRDGITALQMDIKIESLSPEIMEKALMQAKEGRHYILDRMEETIKKPKTELSPYAPSIITVKVSPDRIGDIIGPGGKHIRALQAETNTQIEIDDTGTVKIAAFSKEDAESAAEIVKEIGSNPEIGEVYEGTVVKVTDFGAFVQIKPKTEGLVHISELAHYRVKKVSDILKEGDKVKVKVIEIGNDGKIRLSRKALLEPENPPADSGDSDDRRRNHHRQDRSRPRRNSRDSSSKRHNRR